MGTSFRSRVLSPQETKRSARNCWQVRNSSTTCFQEPSNGGNTLALSFNLCFTILDSFKICKITSILRNRIKLIFELKIWKTDESFRASVASSITSSRRRRRYRRSSWFIVDRCVAGFWFIRVFDFLVNQTNIWRCLEQWLVLQLLIYPSRWKPKNYSKLHHFQEV